MTGDEVQEYEDYYDDGQWWQPIMDVVEDITDQDIPGSVVILIVVALLAPQIVKGISAWRKGK